jgi:hypothetical protein
MSNVTRIEKNSLRMPPSWISRATARSGAMGNSEEIKKLLGEPIPRLANPKDVPPEIMAMFGSKGMLERLRKKLAAISRRKGGKILPAHNTIASVDENDNLYVGVEFLEAFGEDEDLVAGILAHEWGHMMSDLPRGMDWSHLSWEELNELRRQEEADADGFAGRALCLMGYKPESMMKFLKQLDAKKKKTKDLPNHKYHNTATRVEILKQSWEAGEKAMKVARKLFVASKDSGIGAKVGRVISTA